MTYRRRIRRHKSRKNRKSRTYKKRRQRGGDDISQTPMTSSNVPVPAPVQSDVNSTLDSANKKIGEATKSVSDSVTGFFGSLFTSDTPTQSVGGRRRRRKRRTYKR